MSFQPYQLRELIREVLEMMGEKPENMDNAVELLMLTAAAESQLGSYIEQVGGPALGIFQMEPATERDIYENYLKYRDDEKAFVKRFKLPVYSALNLKANLIYQIIMARIHYKRDSKPIPSKDNTTNLAKYYKRVWNTHRGAATISGAVAAYWAYAH